MKLRFSPLQHALACFVLAVVLFSLAAGAHSWNEVVHYRIYLALGLVFTALGFGPLVVHSRAGKAK